MVGSVAPTELKGNNGHAAGVTLRSTTCLCADHAYGVVPSIEGLSNGFFYIPKTSECDPSRSNLTILVSSSSHSKRKSEPM